MPSPEDDYDDSFILPSSLPLPRSAHSSLGPLPDDDDPFAGLSDDDTPVPPAPRGLKPKPSYTQLSTAGKERERTTSLDLWETDPDFPVGSVRLKGVLQAKGLTPLSQAFSKPTEGDGDFDWDEEDEKESTIKGLAGLKLQAGRSGTIKGMQTISLPSVPAPRKADPQPEEDLESSFDLGEGMGTLKLRPREVRGKASISSFSEISSAGGGKKRDMGEPRDRQRQSLMTNTSAATTIEGSQSPSTSSTSMTSFSVPTSDFSPSSPTSSRPAHLLPVKIAGEEEEDEEEDIEEGLELPSQTFFSSGMVGELNRLLDRKRRPQRDLGMGKPNPTNGTIGTPQRIPSDLTRPTIASLARSRGHERKEEAFEDGLVLELGGKELNRNRLVKLRRARPSGAGVGVVGRFGGALKKVLGREGEGRVKSGFIGADEWRDGRRELGGRNSSANLLGLTGGEGERKRGENGHRSTTNPSPSPLPTQTSGLPTSPSMGNLAPTTPSKLRGQKSMARLQHPPPPPPPILSPSLSRKQSLDAFGSRARDSFASPTASASIKTTRKSSDADSGAMGSWGRSMGASSTRSSTPSDQGSWSRLTQPTSSTLAKARPSMNTVFPRPSAQRAGSGSGSGFRETQQVSPPIEEEEVEGLVGRKPRGKVYGDGTELDGFEDLLVDRGREGVMKVPVGFGGSGGGTIKANGSGRKEALPTPAIPQVPRSTSKPLLVGEKRKKPSSSGKTKHDKPKKTPALIRHLGGDADKTRTVGDMTWNPQTSRWEGNYGVLRDFENHPPSSRPALITHYSPSSTSLAALASPGGVTSSASSIKIVGDMRFDSEKMCWISTLAPGEDEPDPFEGMADDEDDEADRGGTITKSAAKILFAGISIGLGSGSDGHRLISETSGGGSIATAGTEEESLDGASYHPPELAAAVDEALWRECREAEGRHKQEMRGWVIKGPVGAAELGERKRREEKRLWEIWNLAARS